MVTDLESQLTEAEAILDLWFSAQPQFVPLTLMFYDKVFNHMITHYFVVKFSALVNLRKRQGPEEESWLCRK